MWEEKIEELYKSWINDGRFFKEGESKLLKFFWACIQNEESAPSQEELKNQVKRDLSEKYPGYNEDRKNEIVSKVESLYLTIKKYEEIRKEN